MLSGADSAAAPGADQSQNFQLPDADAAMNQQADIAAAQDWINADEAGKTAIEQTTGMSGAQLQDIAVGNDLKPGISTTDSLAPGEEIAPSGGTTGMAGQFDGGQYEIVKGDTLGHIAQANGVSAEDIKGLNPQINWAKPLQPGMNINLPPSGDGAGSVWQGYTGDVYGDKVANAAGQGTGQGAMSNPSAASDYGMGGNAPIDYTQPGPMSADSLGQKLEYGIPVNDQGSFIPPNPNLPAEELARQQAAYDSWKSDFTKRWPNATQAADGSMQAIKPGLNTMQILNKPTFTPTLPESVKLKTLPANQLIDQKLTVMAWALNESVGKAPSRNLHLTRTGVFTVFENVERHRRALLKEFNAMGPGRTNIPDVPRPDMPGVAAQPGAAQPGAVGRGLNWLDKAAGKVGNYFTKQAQNFTRKVTAAKLKTEWEQLGHFTDSDKIAAFLADQGVPADVITDVYGKMGIPYTATTARSGIQTGATALIDPETGKPYEKDKLAAKWATPAATATAAADAPGATTTTADAPAAATTTTAATKPATAAASKFPGEDPTGANYVGRREVARRQAARDAEAAKKPATPNFAQQGGGYKSVSYAPNIKTGVSLPNTTTAPTTAKLPAGGGAGVKAAATQAPLSKDDYIKRIGADAETATETIKQVKKMLEAVQTKDDVVFIKKYINSQFSKQLSESAVAQRNRLLSEVTRIGALKRRQHSQQISN